MSFPQPRPRLDALGAQLRAMQIAKLLPAPLGSVTVSAVRKDTAGQATQFVIEAEGTLYGKENNEMPKKYVKKPILVEAIQFTRESLKELGEWASTGKRTLGMRVDCDQQLTLTVYTPEGKMTAKLGDYIIKGVRGEFYPCDREIFEETYEPAQEKEETK